jgi:hypothetical protein
LTKALNPAYSIAMNALSPCPFCHDDFAPFLVRNLSQMAVVMQIRCLEQRGGCGARSHEIYSDLEYETEADLEQHERELTYMWNTLGEIA